MRRVPALNGFGNSANACVAMGVQANCWSLMTLIWQLRMTTTLPPPPRPRTRNNSTVVHPVRFGRSGRNRYDGIADLRAFADAIWIVDSRSNHAPSDWNSVIRCRLVWPSSPTTAHPNASASVQTGEDPERRATTRENLGWL